MRMVWRDPNFFADGFDALTPEVACRMRMGGFAPKKKMPAFRRELLQERYERFWDEDRNWSSRFRRVEVDSIVRQLGRFEERRIADSKPGMSERENEGKLSVVFRFAEDVLDFLFTEWEAWIYFDLRRFDAFRWVLREPAAVDAELEERS